MKDQFDCIVIGGGPAGTTTAALVAAAGFSVLLLEREKMPRTQIGESLVPGAYWGCQPPGIFEEIKSSPLFPTVGVELKNHTGEPLGLGRVADGDLESSEVWQVDHGDFGYLLFRRAREFGAEAVDATPPPHIVFQHDRAAGVRREEDDELLRAQVVVDATGQELLASQLEVTPEELPLRKAAIWGYYRGARREAGSRPAFMQTRDERSWFWSLPLADDLTSIGVVSSHQHLQEGHRRPADAFEDELVNCPALAERLMDAQLVGRLHVARESGGYVGQRAGEGWLLLGDPGGFVDPIFSTGLLLALRCGELAARAIIEALRCSDTRGEQLGKWIPAYRRAADRIHERVNAFYTHGRRLKPGDVAMEEQAEPRPVVES